MRLEGEGQSQNVEDRRGGRGGTDGQFDAEFAADGRLRTAREASAVGGDDHSADVEAEAEATLSGGGMGIED